MNNKNKNKLRRKMVTRKRGWNQRQETQLKPRIPFDLLLLFFFSGCLFFARK